MNAEKLLVLLLFSNSDTASPASVLHSHCISQFTGFYFGILYPRKGRVTMSEQEKMSINQTIFVTAEEVPVYMEVLSLCKEYYAGPLSPVPEGDKKYWDEEIDHQKELLASSFKNKSGCIILMTAHELKALHEFFDKAAGTFYYPTRNLLHKYVADMCERGQEDPDDPHLVEPKRLALYVMAKRNLESKIEICNALMDYINKTYERLEREDH